MESLSERLLIDDVREVDSLENKVRQSITNGINIRLAAYVINAGVEQILTTAADGILQRYGFSGLSTTTALVLKELTTNAAKANLKHWLLTHDRPGVDSASPEFLAEFRKILGSGGLEPYRERLKEAGLLVGVLFEHDAAGLRLSVSNGFPVQSAEKNRLLAKLNSATEAGDLRHFFDKGRQDAEGAGLGFALMVNALRSAGLGKDALTFDTDANAAMRARVVFSFAALKKQGENHG